MIMALDENNKLILTDKAMHIKAFRKLYENYTDKELSLRYFAYIYWMYHYDSRFLLEEESVVKRGKLVKAFIHKGSTIRPCGMLDDAVKVYKKIQAQEEGDVFRVLKANISKLKDYAERMTLIPVGNPLDYEEHTMPILVKSKEFSEVNKLLPSLQDDLSRFSLKLREQEKSNIEIYGGGEIGAYEQ